jgi:hypothetical protein
MFYRGMAWIIIDSAGHPLMDTDGTMILVDSKEAAREWLMRDDQRVERFESWQFRVPWRSLDA